MKKQITIALALAFLALPAMAAPSKQQELIERVVYQYKVVNDLRKLMDSQVLVIESDRGLGQKHEPVRVESCAEYGPSVKRGIRELLEYEERTLDWLISELDKSNKSQR